MQLKPGVNARDVDPMLWAYLGAIAQLYRTFTGGKELVVTSLRREPGKRASRHAPPKGRLVEAADLRSDVLREMKGDEQFARTLQVTFGKELGVVLEPEWLSAAELEERGGADKVTPHLHIQLKGGGRLL